MGRVAMGHIFAEWEDPLNKNAIAMPGSIACEKASPNKLCWRKKANTPKNPEIAPNMIDPKNTTIKAICMMVHSSFFAHRHDQAHGLLRHL